SAISALTAKPNMQAMRTACSLSTGKVPGMAKSIKLAWVLGSAPKAVSLPENIFVFVASCAWICSPIPVSHCIVIVLRIRLAFVCANQCVVEIGGRPVGGALLGSKVPVIVSRPASHQPCQLAWISQEYRQG